MVMKLIVIAALTLHVAVTLSSGACTNSLKKRCESWGWAYTDCKVAEATVISDVTATTVDSGTDSCTLHGTFGWNGNTIWVDNGCRAEFTVCYETFACPNTDTKLCESWGWAYTECDISGTAVVEHASVSKLHGGTCDLNTGFGWKDNKIWVNHGCRADFSVCYEEGLCANTEIKKCESWSWAYAECEISASQAKISKVTPQTVHSGTDSCKLDTDYGWEGKKVWVNNGCRADFKVCYDKEKVIGPCTKSRTVECQSWEWAYAECEVGSAAYLTSVTVKTQQSDATAPCKLDDGFGFYNHKLWVNKGCRAEFNVCYIPGNGPCADEVTKKCESWGWAYKECVISEAARVTSVVISKVHGGDCTYDKGFGMLDNKVWVNHGCRADFKVCYEPPSSANPDDTGVSPHKWCYKDYPILDGLLCYEACRSGYSNHGGGPLCWGSCPSGTINFGLFCTKKSYGRGGGSPLSTCASADDKDGLLCYPECKSGYNGVGPVCWEYCKSGYTNDGALCRRNAHIYGRSVGDCPWHDKCGLCGGPWYNVCGKRRNCGGSCKSGYKNDGCTCRRDVHIYAKDTYGRGWGDAMGCEADEEKDGALCYPKCKSGYNGIGPVCWATCSGQTIDTGTQCQKKAYGRGVGKVINCLKLPTLNDVANSSGLVQIMEGADGIQILQSAACAKLYNEAQFWIVLAQSFNMCHKEEKWTTVSISYAAGAAAGIEVSAEVGIAVNIKTSKGVCYVGYCAGIKTDVSIGAEIVFGWWRSLDDVPGESKVFEFGVDIPFTEIGFSATFVTNMDGDYIATQVSLGVGVGLLPIEVGFSKCNTPEDAIVKFDV